MQDILINWAPQETRVAVVENGALQELYLERTLERGLVILEDALANLARVSRLPGMDHTYVAVNFSPLQFEPGLPTRIAAMASSIAAIGAVVAQETALGAANSVVINSADGFVQVFTVNREDVQLIVNVVSDSTGVLAQVAYRGRTMAQTLLTA